MDILKISRAAFQQWADEGRFLVIAWLARDFDRTRLLEFASIITTHCPQAYLAQINIDEAMEQAAMFAISEAPALLIMRERVVLYCEPGLPEPEVFQRLIERTARLNMTAIREEIEQEKQAEISLRMRRVCPTARRQK